MADPTGEADRNALRLDFDRRLMLQFRGSTITSDGGLLAYRELEDTFGLTDTGAERLADARTGRKGCALIKENGPVQVPRGGQSIALTAHGAPSWLKFLVSPARSATNLRLWIGHPGNIGFSK